MFQIIHVDQLAHISNMYWLHGQIRLLWNNEIRETIIIINVWFIISQLITSKINANQLQ